MSKSDLKLNSISPYRNKLVAVILFLFGIISFIALADYDPEDFHRSPTISDSLFWVKQTFHCKKF